MLGEQFFYEQVFVPFPYPAHLSVHHFLPCPCFKLFVSSFFWGKVFELVSCESFNPSSGVNVTGLRENYLEMSIKPGVLVFISLESSKQGDQDTPNSKDAQNEDDIQWGVLSGK